MCVSAICEVGCRDTAPNRLGILGRCALFATRAIAVTWSRASFESPSVTGPLPVFFSRDGSDAGVGTADSGPRLRDKRGRGGVYATSAFSFLTSGGLLVC